MGAGARPTYLPDPSVQGQSLSQESSYQLLWVRFPGCYGPRVSTSEREGASVGHPNEDLIRRGYDAFSRGDTDTLRELYHPDIVWHAPGRSQLAGDHQGVDAVFGFFGQTMEMTGGNFGVEVHDVVATTITRSASTRPTLSGQVERWRATAPWSFTSATARSPRSGSTGRTSTPPTSCSASSPLRSITQSRTPTRAEVVSVLAGRATP